jgi:hypothetical protein
VYPTPGSLENLPVSAPGSAREARLGHDGCHRRRRRTTACVGVERDRQDAVALADAGVEGDPGRAEARASAATGSAVLFTRSVVAGTAAAAEQAATAAAARALGAAGTPAAVTLGARDGVPAASGPALALRGAVSSERRTVAAVATAPELPSRATTGRFITRIHPFPPRRPADVAF